MKVYLAIMSALLLIPASAAELKPVKLPGAISVGTAKSCGMDAVDREGVRHNKCQLIVTNSFPGVLSVGAEYCTPAGQCKAVGADQDCVFQAAPRTDPCRRMGVPQGSLCVPRRVCQPSAAPGKELPVTVILTDNEMVSAKVSIHGKLYNLGIGAEPNKGIYIIYHDVRMTLANYEFCFPFPDHTYEMHGGERPVCPN
jgi:hypothetical protein